MTESAFIDINSNEFKRYQLLYAWVSRHGNYWYGNTPIDYNVGREHGYQRLDGGVKLADKLHIPEIFITQSRMPADFSLDKKVEIENFGAVHIRVYKSGERGLLRFYMDCPACGKHLSMGRWWQHMDVHVRYNCKECGESMSYSNMRDHRLMHRRDSKPWESNG